jgi:isoamyl acetate esterase
MIGYNTEQYRAILPSILNGATLDGSKIAIATLFLGANDAALSMQPVSISRYVENLNYMLGFIQSTSPSTKVVLITPPPVGITQTFPDRDADHTRLYRNAVLEVGKNATMSSSSNTSSSSLKCWNETSLVTLDLWDLFLGVGNGSLRYTEDQIHDYLIDGLHLDVKGGKAVGNALYEIMKDM